MPFPWREVMGFGLGVLRLAPNAFWSMTPAELAAAATALGPADASPMRRHDLDRLMRRFPDQPPAPATFIPPTLF